MSYQDKVNGVLNSYGKVSGMIQFGSEMLEMGALLSNVKWVAKASNKIKAENPPLYEIHNRLSRAFQESKIDHSVYGTKEGDLLYRSKELNNIWDPPKFESFGIISEDLVVTLGYIPEFSYYVSSNMSKFFLLNWVNKQLSVGKFVLFDIVSNIIRNDLQRLAYIIQIDCSELSAETVGFLLRNAVNKLVGFREIFMPIIEPIANGDLSFESNGSLSGKNSDKIQNEFLQTRSKLYNGFTPEEQSALHARLLGLLENYNFVIDDSKKDFIQLDGMLEGDYKFSMHAYFNNHSQLVLQSYSTPLENKGWIMIANYLTYVNNTNTGVFYYDQQSSRIVFRNSLDLLGCNKILPEKPLTHIIEEQILANQILLPGFEILAGPDQNPIEVLKNLEISKTGSLPTHVPEFQSSTESSVINIEDQTSIYENIEMETNTINDNLDMIQNSISELIANSKKTNPAIQNSGQDSKKSIPLKNKNLSVLAEVLPGFLGILGLGWLYSGNIAIGIAVLIGTLIWDVFALFVTLLTGGLGILCILPVHLMIIGVSTFLLNNYIKSVPELFEK